MSYGTIGNGSLAHRAMTLLGKQNNLNWQHVPYKGGGPMMQDAVGGRPAGHRVRCLSSSRTLTVGACARWR